MPILFNNSCAQQSAQRNTVVFESDRRGRTLDLAVNAAINPIAILFIVIHYTDHVLVAGLQSLFDQTFICIGRNCPQQSPQVPAEIKIRILAVRMNKSQNTFQEIGTFHQSRHMPEKHPLQNDIEHIFLEHIPDNRVRGRDPHESGVVAGHQITLSGNKKKIFPGIRAVIHDINHSQFDRSSRVIRRYMPQALLPLADDRVRVDISSNTASQTIHLPRLIGKQRRGISQIIFNADQPLFVEHIGSPDQISDIPAEPAQFILMVLIDRNDENRVRGKLPKKCFRFNDIIRDSQTVGIHIHRVDITAGAFQKFPEFIRRPQYSMADRAAAVAERFPA